MAWTLTSGSLSSSSSVTISSITFKASELKRYSWRCPTTGTYQWLSTIPSGEYCDTYGWVSTSSTAYDLSKTSHPISGSYITSNDDDNGNGQFICTFSATAGTTYYLYASPYSPSTDPSGKTFQFQVRTAVPLWTVIGSSLTSATTASANRSYSTAGQIYRYAWTCPTTGLYQWYGSSIGNTCYFWVATTSNAYNLYATNYPASNALAANSAADGCTFQATANTTYYLYSSAWSNTVTSQSTQTQTIRQVYWRLLDYGNFLSSGTTCNTTLSGQTIQRYTFTAPTSGTYIFAASNCTTDSVGWISDSSTAYDLTKASNSRSMGTWSDDDSNGSSQFKVTASLVGGTLYYLYISPYSSSTMAYNNSVSITLTLTLSSANSIVGTFIKASQISAFKTLWQGLCTSRRYYGNLNNSTAKNAFSTPTRGNIATSSQMNSILNTFNKYFTPTITTVNTGELIQGSKFNTLVTNTMNSPNCKVACTGFCSSTNSGAAQPATCSSCDTGCSSSCYGACRKTCSGSCGTGCYGYCRSECDSDCSYGCTYDCGGYCNYNCEGNGGWAPSRDCGSYCNSQCGSTCGGGCVYDCWSCDGGCVNSCDDSCNTGCTYDCTGDCEGGCDNSCRGYCDTNCTANCAGGTSGTAGACNGSCTHSCATSCSTLCVTSSS